MRNQSFRLQKANRLHDDHSFSTIFKKGKRFYLQAGMYICLAHSLNISRIGLIIAKKKIRSAAKRNYLKRIQRECFRHEQFSIPGYDIIFVANPKIGQQCQKKWFDFCQSDWRSLSKRLPACLSS